jgi:hypothetical protein
MLLLQIAYCLLKKQNEEGVLFEYTQWFVTITGNVVIYENTVYAKKFLHEGTSSLISCIHSSMALQPFVGPWPLLQFRNLFYTDGRTRWTSDQPVARPLPKHRTTQTQNKRVPTPNIHALSGIRTHDPSI